MDDAEYLFKQDAREKKQIARSARNKVRHTGCKLPSDYMTRREKKALNGEVKTMNIHKPMTYKFFKMMAADLQAEYIQFLHDRFNATAKDIAKKFGISIGTLQNYTSRRKLKLSIHANRFTKLKEQEWEAFWAGETIENIQNAPESLENARSETNSVSEGDSAVSENAPESDEKALSEEYIAEATEKLWNDMAEEAKWRLVAQARETLAKLEKEMAANSLATNGRKLEICGHYGEAQDMTLDEVVLEQPFRTNSLVVTLCDIRDWESVVKTLSTFPLPEHNTVTITIYDVNKKN